MLDQFPLEVLYLILDFLPSTADLKSLNQVSRQLYCTTSARLYRDLTFSAASEWLLTCLNIQQFIDSRSRGTALQHLRSVRKLNITAPNHFVRNRRCSFRTALPYDWYIAKRQNIDSDILHYDFLCDLMNQIWLIFDGLTVNALDGFCWHLGTCLPAQVLDEGGYLTLRQSKMQTISLHTDPTCSHAGSRLDGLRTMKHLRTISWRGIVTDEEMDILCQCVYNNLVHLRKLGIGFGSNVDPSVHESLETLITMLSLPDLHELSLSNCMVGQTDKTLTVFTLPHLRSLTLWNCPSQLLLLESICRRQLPVRLRFFEMVLDELQEPETYTGNHALANFLLSFNTLEHLHLLVCSFLTESVHFLRGVSQHHSLKCLVYHDRHLLSVAGEVMVPTIRDIPVPWSISAWIGRSQPANLGLCLTPSAARNLLEPLVPGLTLQILHLRSTGSEHLVCDLKQAVLSEMSDSSFSSDADSSDMESNTSSIGIRERNRPTSGHNILGKRHIEDCCSYPTISDSNYVRGLNSERFDSYSRATELCNFADWAFGPDGIPNLKLLAYGDFTCEDPHSQQQVILCRTACFPGFSSFGTHGLPYFFTDIFDSSLLSEVENSQETLRACPVSGPTEFVEEQQSL